MNKQTLVMLAFLTLLLVACGGLEQKYAEELEDSFAVGTAPTLTVDNFAGDVIVNTGEEGRIRVLATKRSAREKDLDRIEVDMDEGDGEVQIVTDPPSGLKNVSVDLEITVPASAYVDLHTGAGDIIVRDLEGDVRADSGAGDVDVRGTSGEIDAHTGAGSIDVRRAVGAVYLDVGAGSINYQGTPQGYCRFDTGAGTIKIRIPEDANVEVDLDTGVGDIDVNMIVDGKVSNRKVKGTIGSGDEGEIRAHTGAGNIDLVGE
jgi:DUF4097 and DUF4098 domain-containing protein YvlB